MRNGYESILERAQNEYEYALHSFKELSDAPSHNLLWKFWHDFLVHYKSTTGALKRATESGASTQWSGNLINEQRSDPFLKYAFHARNEAEHRMEAERETVHARAEMDGVFVFEGNGTAQFSDITVVGKSGKATPLTGSVTVKDGKVEEQTIPGQPFKNRPPFLVLSTVVDKKIEYALPNPSTDQEKQATEIALYVLNWLEEKLLQARELADQEGP